MQPSDIDIQALVRRVPARALTRFAPAPTGWLHLGHVLNARYVWGIAEATGGRVLLRIEDHDRERCRPEFETGILDDLDWLGFAPDVFATRDFRTGRCDGRQSDRARDYLEAVADPRRAGSGLWVRLLAQGHPGRHRWHGRRRGALLSGTCRNRGLPLSDEVGWRVRLDPEPNEPELFDDAMLGPQSQDPMIQCGDLLIRDRRGNWTYQFAVTVDDWRQQIDLVIRGRDLLRQQDVRSGWRRMLGRERPARLPASSADHEVRRSEVEQVRPRHRRPGPPRHRLDCGPSARCGSRRGRGQRNEL